MTKKEPQVEKPKNIVINSLVPDAFCGVPWYHFSVDDVFDSLIEVTKKDIPLFSHPFFGLMKEVHDEYETQVDLELFWEREIDGILYTLENVRDFTEEIKKAGGWLRFGPHAESYMTAPFEQSPEEQKIVFDKIYKEIKRFAGNECCAEWVRLHYYSESYELFDYFSKKGVTALFSTDREVGSHRMPVHVAQQLLAEGSSSYDGMNFIRTQYRVEVFTNHRLTEDEIRRLFEESIKRYGYICFYSHEYEFARSEVRNMFRKMFKVLNDLGIKSIIQTNKVMS